MTRKKVLIISILGMPEVLRDDLFDNCLEGHTDLDWITRRLKQIGFDKQILLDFVRKLNSHFQRNINYIGVAITAILFSKL